MNKGLRLDNTSGFKGVSYHKRFKKWSAKITQDGKRRHIGWYDTAEEAYDAHCKAAEELYGEYARLR